MHAMRYCRYIFEIICVALFTIDLVVRGFGASFGGKGKIFFSSFLNWVDLAAIAPVRASSGMHCANLSIL